jgi:hypothetical protein
MATLPEFYEPESPKGATLGCSAGMLLGYSITVVVFVAVVMDIYVTVDGGAEEKMVSSMVVGLGVTMMRVVVIDTIEPGCVVVMINVEIDTLGVGEE